MPNIFDQLLFFMD